MIKIFKAKKLSFVCVLVMIQVGCLPEYYEDDGDAGEFSPGYGDAGLTYRTISGDEDGDGDYFQQCSGYERTIQWGFENKSSNEGGYIIQNIYISNPEIQACKNFLYDEDYYYYWEAFEVPPNSEIGGPDIWQIVNRKADNVEWEFTGSAVYFPTMTEADLIDAGFVDGAYVIDEYPELYIYSMNTAGQYFTPVPPIFWGNASLHRNVRLNDCTCCSVDPNEREPSDSHEY